MPEMARAGHYEGQTLLLAILYGVVVANGTSGLDKSRDAGGMTQFHTVIEGEEGVAGHDRSLQVESELAGFFDSLSK